MTKQFDAMNVFDTSQVSKQKLNMKSALIGENGIFLSSKSARLSESVRFWKNICTHEVASTLCEEV